MSEQLTPINALANNTLLTLITLANTIVSLLASDVVTANGSANGGLTIGNSYISGISGASVLVGGALRGGNVQSSATLPVTSNVNITNGGVLSIGNTTANATVNSINITIPTGTFTNAQVQFFPQSNLSFANSSLYEVDLTTTGAGTVTLDSFPMATLRSAEYMLQVTDNAANNKQVSKLLVIHDGVNPLFTEYALLTTNTTICTFSATSNATTLIIQATPTSVNTTIRALRTSLNV